MTGPDSGSADGLWLAELLEQHRPRLRAIAYQMLGSITEADDALQEVWIRTRRADPGAIENVDGWLTTVLGRVCIDHLRARRSRPEGTTERLPEPVVAEGDEHDPESRALLADSVGLALLVVLQSLEPRERVAFVLHDVFAMPFSEIAPVVDGTDVAARQLASRARRKIRGTTPPPASPATQRPVVEAFLAAARAGDFERLVTLLDPDIDFRTDAGALVGTPPPRMSGATAVAEQIATQGPAYARLCEPAMVNGAPGIVARRRGRVVAVAGFDVVDGRISAINLIIDPAKL